MFRHITCHPQGAIMFLAKITGKTICKSWTYIVWRVWQHIMNSRVHACIVCYCAWWYVHRLWLDCWTEEDSDDTTSGDGQYTHPGWPESSATPLWEPPTFISLICIQFNEAVSSANCAALRDSVINDQWFKKVVEEGGRDSHQNLPWGTETNHENPQNFLYAGGHQSRILLQCKIELILTTQLARCGPCIVTCYS
jgi:hypothetical protein